MNFAELELGENIIKGLASQGINAPTEVQEKAIPFILQDKNVVIQSQTGTGKTLAYLLPAYARLDPAARVMQLLVLVPTHELALQVHRQVELFSKNSGIGLKSIVLFGDVNIKTQVERLKEKPQIIIGTAGRIRELMVMKKVTAHTIKTIVIDEADKMLDIHNIESVKAIRKCVMRDTQIIMCSASISEETLKTAGEMAKDPIVVKTTQTLKIPENMKHMYLVCEVRDKLEVLRKLMNILKPKRAIAFINSADQIDLATAKLQYHQIKAQSIYGTNSKEDRRDAMNAFASGKLQLLIASDIAARGLHIEDVEVVFSVSMSDDPLDYLHRSGRAGRGKGQGLSISIVTKREVPLMKRYENAFGIHIAHVRMYKGKILEGSQHPQKTAEGTPSDADLDEDMESDTDI